jgi:hypothetical protein
LNERTVRAAQFQAAGQIVLRFRPLAGGIDDLQAMGLVKLMGLSGPLRKPALQLQPRFPLLWIGHGPVALSHDIGS